MIEIKELRALRGPNRHTRHSAIFMVLDIMEYEKQPSNTINKRIFRTLGKTYSKSSRT